MRPRFFVGTLDPVLGPVAVGLVVTLGESDAHHARTVLRSQVGDPCELVFPAAAGVLAEAVFEDVGRRVCARVTAVLPVPPQRVRLLLVQALPQPRKVDEVIEKGTEVGFDSFLVVPASGSPRVPREKLEARVARWRVIAGEAAKQSRQPAVPAVRTAASLEEALELTRSEGWEQVVLTPDADDHLGDVLAAEAGATGRWAVWVGPEGGWSARELEVLRAAGVRPAWLGSRVLRTETAGPVAGALARYALSDW